MPDVIPPPPPPPTVNIVQVSAAQVWSAAIQNIAIAAILGALMYTKVLGAELGSVLLAAVAGIDLASRLRAKANPVAALAVGATGMFGHMSGVVLALVAALGLVAGCGSLPDPLPKDAKSATQAVRSAVDSAIYVCGLPVEHSPELSEMCSGILAARQGLCADPGHGEDAGTGK